MGENGWKKNKFKNEAERWKGSPQKFSPVHPCDPSRTIFPVFSSSLKLKKFNASGNLALPYPRSQPWGWQSLGAHGVVFLLFHRKTTLYKQPSCHKQPMKGAETLDALGGQILEGGTLSLWKADAPRNPQAARLSREGAKGKEDLAWPEAGGDVSSHELWGQQLWIRHDIIAPMTQLISYSFYAEKPILRIPLHKEEGDLPSHGWLSHSSY